MGSEGRALQDQVNGFAGRVEVIEGPSGRRSWPDDVKARIVRESLEPGATVSEVARRHRISPQHLTLWRRAARQVACRFPLDTTRRLVTHRLCHWPLIRIGVSRFLP